MESVWGVMKNFAMTTELILFTILDLRCALKKDRQHEERG
jgi:hypothetical protein